MTLPLYYRLTKIPTAEVKIINPQNLPILKWDNGPYKNIVSLSVSVHHHTQLQKRRPGGDLKLNFKKLICRDFPSTQPPPPWRVGGMSFHLRLSPRESLMCVLRSK